MAWGGLRRLRRPTRAQVASCLAAAEAPFSYPEVGATGGAGTALPQTLAATYDLDHYRFPLGAGRERFERAREALWAWRHFDVPWLEFFGGERPACTGQVVASLVCVARLWFLNPCRVVYTELDEAAPDRAAFAYGTLAGHVDRGEERFQLTFDPDTEVVTYEIFAFSRPGLWLTKLGYPLGRQYQKRFAHASGAVLARAVA